MKISEYGPSQKGNMGGKENTGLAFKGLGCTAGRPTPSFRAERFETSKLDTFPLDWVCPGFAKKLRAAKTRNPGSPLYGEKDEMH